MKRLLCLLLALLLCSGCGREAPEKTMDSGSAVTFTDDLGRPVTVQAPPRRTAALLGSFAQIWQLAGGEVCATADDAWEDLDLSLSPDTVNLGSIRQLSLERLLSAKPDLILASTNTRQHLEWKELLEETGIPVAYFDVADFEGYLRLLSICTDLTGRKDLYEQHGLAPQKQIEQVREQSRRRLAEQEPPVVLSLRASAASIHAKNSVGNVMGEMLKDLGCVNIADSEESLLENLSLERILEADPDYIFIVQRGDDRAGTEAHLRQFIAENPAWAQLTAVQQDRVYYMEKDLFSLKPNHRWGEAYQQVEDILSHE